MSTIGTKVRKIRELKGFKQEFMADQLGVSVGAYSKMERNETEITHERLQQIAKVFDLSVPDILAFDEKMVFNFINSQNPSGGNSQPVYNYYISDNEKNEKLYEDKIRLLEEMNEYLRSEIERLKSSK